ncbi:hypothetical protein HBI56_186570 [Parastagonospora nodorum]|nr:hypothetical protein HBH92_209830 [Parastagonospora nodorum]KAH4428096.1 hypothetical protein HBH93_163650 [Parastagonospora nodorum]KAH4438056.1 hypothetical protein HBH91_187460 [Parastagonospora nodorum]KAH4497954.1 hypothetical protein HBH89_131560 [Parastagonospora nodorum]KAH4533256.1 hypothetical protein HBH85_171960 [Parastagonospora nodorum]
MKIDLALSRPFLIKMHIPTFSLAVFATLTTAQDFCTSNASTPGYCELLSLTDRTLNVTSPPSSSDCQDACRGVLGEAGDWSVDFKGKPPGYIQNMVGSPCGFSMGRAPGQPLEYAFLISNQDIVGILAEVVRRFAGVHGGEVAAEGRVRCGDSEGVWYVR